MYDTEIQTSLSIRGNIIFVCYQVTKDWALEWWLNPGEYDEGREEYPVLCQSMQMLDTLLRVHENERIEQILLSDFEHRQYAEEERTAMQLAQEDIPF